MSRRASRKLMLAHVVNFREARRLGVLKIPSSQRLLALQVQPSFPEEMASIVQMQLP